MAEEIKLRMARAYPAQIQRMREWFQSLDELYHDEYVSDADIAIFIHAHYGDVESDWERILFGYETLIENVCDQTKSHLEYKPEILAAFAVASGAGELVEAAEKVYQLRDAMSAVGPSALIVALAMIDLHKAAEKVRQGSASNTFDVGNLRTF